MLFSAIDAFASHQRMLFLPEKQSTKDRAVSRLSIGTQSTSHESPLTIAKLAADGALGALGEKSQKREFSPVETPSISARPTHHVASRDPMTVPGPRLATIMTCDQRQTAYQYERGHSCKDNTAVLVKRVGHRLSAITSSISTTMCRS